MTASLLLKNEEAVMNTSTPLHERKQVKHVCS